MLINFENIRTTILDNGNRGFLVNPKYVRGNQNVVIDCRVESYNEDWDKVEWCKNEVFFKKLLSPLM